MLRPSSRSAPVALLVLSLPFTLAQAKRPAAPDALADARRAYNEQKFDEAARLAAEAAANPALRSAALVVGARAGLERFRVGRNVEDLDAAREALRSVDAATLSPRDQVEFSIGLGEALYLDDQYPFDDRYSAAAAEFEIALGRPDLLDAASRDLLFEWWALAVDRQAQLGPERDRHAAYQRIVDRAEAELAREPDSPSALYWTAAAARGVDDLPRAWGAAVSAWVRAGRMGTRGVSLREDLERLVVQVILPERAKEIATGDARPTLSSLLAQWEQIKQRWQ